MIGIYEIRNTINNKRYIGSSKMLSRRLYQHKHYLIKGIHPNKYLQSAWNKYSPESFIFKQLIECKETDLDFYEDLIIKGYRSNLKEFGYNLRTDPRSNKNTRVRHKAHISGEKHGRLTFIEPAVNDIHGKTRWLCQCDCGRMVVACPSQIRRGHTTSCGCYHREISRLVMNNYHKKTKEIQLLESLQGEVPSH